MPNPAPEAPLSASPPAPPLAPEVGGLSFALASGETLSFEDLLARVIAWAHDASRQEIAAGLPAELQVAGTVSDGGVF